MTKLSDKLISMLPERKDECTDEEYEALMDDGMEPELLDEEHVKMGYNQALDDMAEKFKKFEWDEEKIIDIISEHKKKQKDMELDCFKKHGIIYVDESLLAKALTQADLIKEVG